MFAPDSTSHRSLTLPNGLRVELCSAPRLKRCAAALRVAAGSHDVSGRWPGLAHFLEHLFFLGTEQFPADQNLMAYVQRHGGQVNASTRERTTEFFFELAPAAFAGGLERLCEMLADPRMNLADQLREREVLHAEFIAWSRDEASRAQLKRLQSLSPLHPLRGFHAGNRFSLPAPRADFQQALQDFYRTFYQAGQMTLSLAGPQTLDELQELATAFGGYFAPGSRVEQLAPPVLRGDYSADIQVDEDERRTRLMFACEGLPNGYQQAVEFLCLWMNSAQPSGLLSELQGRGLADSIKAEVLYEFDGQLLLEVEVVLAAAIASELTPTGNTQAPVGNTQAPVGVSLLAKTSDQPNQIHSLIFSWLTFFKANYHNVLDEYARLNQRQREVSGALALARLHSDGNAELGVQSLAISALLDQLVPDALLQPLTLDAIADVNWRLPSPNPFLGPSAISNTAMPLPYALTLSNALPVNGSAATHLRWTLPAPQPTLHRMLADSLKPLAADAQQAGVTLAFDAYGTYWQLKVSGFSEAIPAVLGRALTLLGEPSDETLSRYGAPTHEPVLIPIRRLLKTLPDHFLSTPSLSETSNLPDIWSEARWTGFASGFQHSDQTALAHALTCVPGIPESRPMVATQQVPNQRWQTEPSESSEDALLMFYPTPTNSIEDEALWRLFSHLLQAPFYQRLRVELQLGYAVFSGFRQVAGQSGMLFGVQSPNTNVGQLVKHIETFMKTLPQRVEQADLPTQTAALQDQLDPAAMDTQHSIEMLWQAHLAGHAADYAIRLQHSFAHLHQTEVMNAASRVALSRTPVFYLSNRSDPRRSQLSGL